MRARVRRRSRATNATTRCVRPTYSDDPRRRAFEERASGWRRVRCARESTKRFGERASAKARREEGGSAWSFVRAFVAFMY